MRYAYNATSQLTSMTAADRASVNYGYDAAARLRTITQGGQTFTYSYDVISRLTSLQMPNGVTTSYEYDADSRLTRLLHDKSGIAIEDYRYSYTTESEIASVTSVASLPRLPQERTASVADVNNRISQFGSAT